MHSAVVELPISPRPVLAAKVDQAAASVFGDLAQRVEAREDEPGLFTLSQEPKYGLANIKLLTDRARHTR